VYLLFKLPLKPEFEETTSKLSVVA